MSDARDTARHFDGLRLIGLLKIGKALLLLATTYGLYRMLNPHLVEHLQDWLGTLTDSFERRLLQRALDWLSAPGHARMGGIVVVTGLYTTVLFAEGFGLWMRKIWAEWLTITATASLIPFELWQLLFVRNHNRLAVLAAFTLNVVIVWYLARQLRKARRTPVRTEQP
jgi:uncharacterized membrane protein (DUF2068 family)